MCGLVGYSCSSGTEMETSSLLESNERISHRGPDDSGIYEDKKNGVGLAHTRLSIIDLSELGHQPMIDEQSGVVLAYNGEIYNYRELRAELEESGIQFNGHSDTEVLLNLFLVYRTQINGIETMLRLLNGIFAFAIWDPSSKSTLIARDALGVKPLYYYSNQKTTLFASEIKAMVPMIEDIGELDHHAIDRYLTYLWCPGNGTPVKSIRKVNPGEAIWIKDGQLDNRLQWYKLPAFRPTKKTIGKTESISGTTEHLRTAVHRQMVADVPVGAFLSGGLDSSSIVTFAREVNPDIHCFTIESKGTQDSGFVDDLPYAQRVASHLNVPLEVVTIDSATMIEDLHKMISILDEPLADPASLNVLYISQMARDKGIKVLLSGAGGDDIFSGYRRHKAISNEKYWQWLPKPLLSSLEKISGLADNQHAISRRISKLFSGASLGPMERLVNYFKWMKRDDLLALFSDDFKSILFRENQNDPMMEFLGKIPEELSDLEKMLALEQRFFLADHNLNYTDKMSMAAGIEVRVPFLDLDLVDFASQIPSKYKQRGMTGKWVLKKAMEPYLPKDIIYRPKSGFSAPLERWIRIELNDLINELLSEKNLKNNGLFNPNEVAKLIQKNQQGKIYASYTIFSILCIEIWCRINL